jgi:hypothetical protein
MVFCYFNKIKESYHLVEVASEFGLIPMPVLYGVFFFMGFSALRGQQVSILTL